MPRFEKTKNVDSSAPKPTPAHILERKPRRPKVSAEEVEYRFAAEVVKWSTWQQAKVKSVPKRYLLAYQRAALGLSSSKAAIRAFCQHCMGYGELPESVRDCTARGCPMWAKRPYQNQEPTHAGSK